MSTLNGQNDLSVTAHVASYTLTASDSGTVHSNTGATGTITCSLPAATPGLRYIFTVEAAFEHRIDPNGTETISLPSSGVPQAAGAYLVADAVGESLEIFCAVAGSWRVRGYTGTWTAV